MEASACADAVRDERIFNNLKVKVRALSPADASAQVIEIYSLNRRIGLRIANACSRDKRVFEHILRSGLSEADLSSIRQWMKCVVPRLGVRRTIGIIASSDARERDPELCRACVYWIKRMRLRLSEHELCAIKRLEDLAGATEVP